MANTKNKHRNLISVTPLPSPEEVLKTKITSYAPPRNREYSFDDVCNAMKEYAKLVLDVAAERAVATTESVGKIGMLPRVDKSSILKIKDEL